MPFASLASGDADQAEIADLDRVSASEEKVQDGLAKKRLRKQAQTLGRTRRQVERQWQEKLLALRMEKLLGRRFVAVLENTVLILIFVLFVLITSEALLERARPAGLSVWQHWFFAIADLAVCSVFLFEFTLKLVLAPHRGSYFLRHALIDFLASLPFGFVAHLIELDRMSDLLGQGGGSQAFWHPARIARVARAFRFLRVAIPLVRLARLGLILLRLSDRLVHRMGRLLNRNIVLFEPLQTQKPESSDRHRLIALRSEVEHARTTALARLDRDQSSRLCAASPGRSRSARRAPSRPRSRSCLSRISQPRDTRRGRGRALDPDDPRAAPRRDGPRPGQGRRPLSPAP